ncbi:hypothetical protein [Mucilaginibacter myungsuensis]|uniref:GLPGLI family protein n=1 Tax=Mucilaginibacter myungsuensis TaxID=649104 RepID=A0A929KV52_9SPHI|nr:hypothetical protein [Mucilaginibacter myungsuensis]MBE9661322.1 hypothetical protein [Mucilaginibacter myungsuensis]MDN3597465.1 hypothetical protein [Mucilaginibacter myungsuensis]
MKNSLIITLLAATLALTTACGNKQTEGTLTYELDYQLPDSLKSFAAFLPKSAILHFKGDSAVTIQGSEEESTTMITYHPTDYLVGLFKSGPLKRFQVQFGKEEQKMELPDLSGFEFTKGTATKTVAGYKADQYIVKDKVTGDTTSAWFTHDLKVPANFISMVFNPELGTPVEFSLNQNGMITTTKLKEVKLETVPAGIFTAPAGFIKLTPQQLREMPVEN